MAGVIDIEVNGGMLDIENTSIRIEKVNSFFTTEFYQGDYSFPFELVASPNNLKLLGYANSVDLSERAESYSATVYYYGLPELKCKLKVSAATRRSISVVLNGGIKALASADKKLSSIMPPDFALGNNPTDVKNMATLASKQGNWQTYGFTFVPFYQPNFYDGKNTFFNGVVNRVDSTNGDILLNSITTTNNKYTLVPWLYIHFVLKAIFDYESMVPEGSWWNDTELSKLLITNNRCLDIRPTSYNTFLQRTAVQSFTADGQKVDFDLGPFNTFDNTYGWDETTKEFEIKEVGLINFNIVLYAEVKSSASIQPPVLNGGKFDVYYDGAVIKNIRITGAGFAEVQKVEKYICGFSINATIVDIGKRIYVEYDHVSGQSAIYVEVSNCYFDASYDDTNQPASVTQAIKWADHLPDWTVSELLSKLKTLGANFDLDFTNNTAKIDIASSLLDLNDAVDLSENCEREYVLNTEQIGAGTTLEFATGSETTLTEYDSSKFIGEWFDPSDLPSPTKEGNIYLNGLTNELLEVVKGSGGLNEWQVIGYYAPQLKIGRGENSLSSDLTPAYMCLATNENGSVDENSALMPYFSGKGSSSLFGTGIDAVEPQLVFYRGINEKGPVKVPRGGVYPYAGTGLLSINKNTVGKYCFRLDNPKSIFRVANERLLKADAENPVMEQNMVLTPILFRKIKGYSKVIVRHNVFIIKSLSNEFNRKNARAKAYLLKL